jgi:hypothetical protein
MTKNKIIIQNYLNYNNTSNHKINTSINYRMMYLNLYISRFNYQEKILKRILANNINR